MFDFPLFHHLPPRRPPARCNLTDRPWEVLLNWVALLKQYGFYLKKKKIDGAKKNALAQSVPPGDIETQPATKIVFKGPYNEESTYHQRIKVINSSARRIAYCIKTTKRLRVNAPCGVIDPKEEVILVVSFIKIFGQDDHITVEWTNTPDGAGEFRREWFQGDGLVRRNNLPIEFDLSL
ncbi:CRE-MSP-33 protein [Caenorhabditis remanei]|uniref:Major sperm protein n=1 Tax=Caenorhabditis remanei TaxID=31234 RepID=E3N9N4_CAERE|nr:CRE-MSP-33 protein [Caenorhabditis remanei]